MAIRSPSAQKVEDARAYAKDLSSTNAEVRAKACIALGHLGSATIPHLPRLFRLRDKESRDDGDFDVYEAIMEALEALREAGVDVDAVHVVPDVCDGDPDSDQLAPCLQGLEERGFSISRLRGLAVERRMTEEVTKMEASSVEELKTECKRRGLPFGTLERQRELAACLIASLVWDNMSPIELKREILQSGLSPNGKDPLGKPPNINRNQLAQRLVNSMFVAIWEARGIPAQRLGTTIADSIFFVVMRLENMTDGEVQAQYFEALGKLDIPPESNTSRQYNIASLTQILVWQKLPLAELQKECHQLEGMSESTASYDGEVARRQLIRMLLVNACSDHWEAKNIPVRRLGHESAIRLATENARLARLDGSQLLEEYGPWKLPEDSCKLESSDILNRLKAVALWKEMPVEMLEEECQTIGLSIDAISKGLQADARHQQFVDLLCTGFCLSPWEAARWEEKGIPIRHVGSVEAATALIAQVSCLKDLDTKALQEKYEEIVRLPPEAGQAPQGKDEMLWRLRKVIGWQAFPVNELRRACQELGVPNSGVGPDMSSSEWQCQLVERLVIASWADAWTSQQEVPVNKLGSINAIKAMFHDTARLKAMSKEALLEEYRRIGLPEEALKLPQGQDELLRRLKLVALWRVLTADQLKEECLQSSVPWRKDTSSHCSDDGFRQELMERLIMATCAEAWEAKGIPVRRLLNIQAAARLASQWDRLETLGAKELHAEYLKIGLPSDAEVPKVVELLPRLRQVAMWRAMPASELPKEKRKLGLIGASSPQVDAVTELVCAAWGPSPPSPRENKRRQSTGNPTDRKDGAPPPSMLLRHIAKHFDTLGLPANADADAVKKAYRKLALQHHPDKIKSGSKEQEEAAQKFRDVAKAYEELIDFMGKKS